MSEYIVGLILGSILGLCAGLNLGLEMGTKSTMVEAYERDMAVQCPGVIGYYWECVE